jgi:hypothetical protein
MNTFSEMVLAVNQLNPCRRCNSCLNRNLRSSVPVLDATSARLTRLTRVGTHSFLSSCHLPASMSNPIVSPALASANENSRGFQWNAPGVRDPPVAPPSHGNHPGRNPLPWHGLKFNPLGCFDLRRRLGIFKQEPLIWNTYRRRFLASDLAWLASGASEDNQHDPGQLGFFPEFRALRDSLPSDDLGYAARQEFADGVKKLIWDLVCHTYRSR